MQVCTMLLSNQIAMIPLLKAYFLHKSSTLLGGFWVVLLWVIGVNEDLYWDVKCSEKMYRDLRVDE